MGSGSYLIWAAQPDYKVFADPRIELFPRDIWWDYVSLINVLPGWEDLLNQYGINTIMINPEAQELLVEALEESHMWSVRYKDEAAIIFVKDSIE